MNANEVVARLLFTHTQKTHHTMKNETKRQFYAARGLSNHLRFFEDGLFLIHSRAEYFNDGSVVEEAESIMAKITELQERFVDFECDYLKTNKIDCEELNDLVREMKWWHDETSGFLDKHEI